MPYPTSLFRFLFFFLSGNQNKKGMPENDQPLTLDSIITQVSEESQESPKSEQKNEQNDEKSKTGNTQSATGPQIIVQNINLNLNVNVNIYANNDSQIPTPTNQSTPTKKSSTSKQATGESLLAEHIGSEPEGDYLLEVPQPEQFKGRKTLVLDLDETLIHSSFKPVASADFVIEVEVERKIHKVYVVKRPGLIPFLYQMSQAFEVVIFTASLASYADKVIDEIEKELRSYERDLIENKRGPLNPSERFFAARLYRESCSFWMGAYVKDLKKLGRELNNCIIVDNSPVCYSFQPENAIPIESFFFDKTDSRLQKLTPYLEKMEKDSDIFDSITKIKNQKVMVR